MGESCCGKNAVGHLEIENVGAFDILYVTQYQIRAHTNWTDDEETIDKPVKITETLRLEIELKYDDTKIIEKIISSGEPKNITVATNSSKIEKTVNFISLTTHGTSFDDATYDLEMIVV